MKKLLKLFFLLSFALIPVLVWGQIASSFFNKNFLADEHLVKAELKDAMIKNDFAIIWKTITNDMVYGFIGDNYQRIRIKIITIKKNNVQSDQYDIWGKSMVKGNVCNFKGKLIITSILKHKETHYGVDDELKNKGITGEYTIKGNYLFSEDSTQNHVGIFKGSFQSEFYTTKDGKVHYDDIDMNSDGFTNNQFVGIWTSYDKKQSKICNWGDYRIPNSGHFDIGAGDFSPDDKYLQFGWQSVRDAYSQGQNSTKALKEEKMAWWK